MSSRSKKSSRRSSASTRDQTTSWSEWVWSEERAQWYKYRLDSRGEYQYQYQDPGTQQVLGPATAQDNTYNPAYVPATTSGQDPVVDEYQTTPTYAPAEGSYPSSSYSSVPTPAVNSYGEGIYGSGPRPISTTEGYRNNQQYYPVPNDEGYGDDYQTPQTLNQPILEEDESEGSNESYEEAVPKPDPQPKPCGGQHGCSNGANRDPDGPDPRPPPSRYASGNTPKYQARGSRHGRNSTDKGSSSSKGKTRTHSGANEPVIMGETEFDPEKEKEFAIWEKEYSTWKDVTCACGFGYYTALGEWISGADVRAGLAPPRPQQDTVEL